MNRPNTYTEEAWECDQESRSGGPADPLLDSPEPIPAAYQNALDAWVDADTGKIITRLHALEMLGPWKNQHAEKCECVKCAESDREWRDEE